MNALLIHTLKQHLLKSLEEDGASLDWTARATAGRAKKGRATIVAKAEGVWCGEGLCPAVESLANEWNLDLKVKSLKRDGEKVKRGEKVVTWSGDSEAILIFERSFLNLASYLSGISTRTSRLVGLTGKSGTRVTSTRKILPGYRDLAIHAVLSGGGHSHRVNLSGGVLIKENHLRAAGGIKKAVAAARATAPHLLKIEVEVTNEKELREALADKVEVIMLDNFSVKDAKAAMKIIRSADYPVLVEASGGITEDTIEEYSALGVDIVSVGGLTHSVTAFDLSLLFEK